jgi:hypothetical protein
VRNRSKIQPGLELGGRYRLEEPIGAGGMGDVWRGVDLRLRRPVAIKILPADLAADQSAVQRFRREAETTAGLQHPGITVTFDIDEHRDDQDPLIFLVMELLRGRDLGTVLDREPGGLPIERAVDLVAQVADALAAAHAHGIVHRDIKPANLFLLDDGRVKLCDFGIARLGDATQLTASGNYIGTPLYMAPEQFRSEPLDARSDLYSLGCVLYELLAGAPPFPPAANPAAIMYQHLDVAPPPLRQRRPDVPAHLERLTLDLLAKAPADRPPDASAVLTSLRGSARPAATTGGWARLAGGPATRQDAPPETVGHSRRVRRRGAVIGLVAAAVVAIATGAIALTWNDAAAHKPNPTPTPSPTPPRTRPLIAGWKTTPAPQYGIAYDAPPNWKREDPDYALYFQDAKSNILAAEKGVAGIEKGKCMRVASGVRGGSRPVLKPSSDQLGVLRSAAGDEARKWAAAAYGLAETPPTQPRVSTGSTGTITLNGITAARASVTVTPAGGGACMPRHAVVETIAMAASPGSSSVGPVFFTVFADRNVPGQVTDDVIEKVIRTVRPYSCPPGTTPRRTNRCA